MKSSVSRQRRMVGLLLFLTVFFLPLHFHFSLAAQVSKQCSCVYGTRTQLALNDDEPLIAPTPGIAILVAPKTQSVVSHQIRSPYVRGPPATLSA